IDQVTGELWDRLVGPVIMLLRGRRIERAQLVPSGLLGLLPLHAAWTSRNGSRTYALDELVFSYTPSARAVVHDRARLADHTTVPRLLAIEEPHPISQANPLPNA